MLPKQKTKTTLGLLENIERKKKLYKILYILLKYKLLYINR